MGSALTKITTNNVELNESNVSDIVVYEKEVSQVTKKEKDNKSSPNTSTGLFKNAILGSFDPRSPSTFITRTPIQIFRSVASSSKFNHQELNESLNESVEIDILTAEEEESLKSNKDLVDAIQQEETSDTKESNVTLPDPRSPTTEIARTPIIATANDAENIKKTEYNKLLKKISDKLIAAKISNNENCTDGQKTKTTEGALKKKAIKPMTEKKLIYEDDQHENFDRFSTPPKKINPQDNGSNRTPLGCVANKDRNFQPRTLMTSTPKGSKIPVLRERPSSARILQK